MYSFLILGIVPGTNLQINFQGWLNLAGLVLSTAVLLRLYRQHQLLTTIFAPRLPLHASQLHQRLHLTAR
jgi:hypothetical protein